MKKIAIIAGAMALAGALFIASPASADGHEPTISATLNDDGSATVSGTGWSDAPAAGLFVTVCSGADVTSDEPVTAGNALVVCPTLIAPDSSANNPTVDDDGAWTFELTAAAVGTVPETGVVILTGCLPLGCTSHSAFTVLTAQAAEEEEPADEPEAEEETEEEGAGGDGEMDEAETMDDDGEMDEAEEMDDGDDTMADTGAESGLLAVIGVSVLLAGLFAVGIGRRFAKRS